MNLPSVTRSTPGGGFLQFAAKIRRRQHGEIDLKLIVEAVLLVLERQIEVLAHELHHASTARRIDERRIQRQQEQMFLLLAFANNTSYLESERILFKQIFLFSFAYQNITTHC